MNAIVLLTLTVLAVVLPASAQFGLPFDTDCQSGRIFDPFLIQALKSKYPKKYSAKLDLAKDLAFDAKCRLHATKLLARHMKNLNAANYDLQNLMYQAQQPGLIPPFAFPDQSALMAQQQQQQQQQQQVFQIPIDASRITLTQQVDPQGCYSQLADPRLQQATLQLTGAQRYDKPSCTSCSACTKPEFPCSCEEGCDNDSMSNPVASVLSTFLGVLKNILK